MIEAIMGILTAILCVSGAVGIIRWIALKIANLGDDGKRIYAVLLDGEQADIRLQMMVQTLEWDIVLNNSRAYVIDGGLSSEMAEYCKIIAEKHRIKYIKADDVATIFE